MVRIGAHGYLDELEDNGFEIEMVDRGSLDLAAELDVIFVVFVENEFVQIAF